MSGTKDELSGREPKPQEERSHPPEWERDLHPDHMAGQNIGPTSQESSRHPRTAYELKGLHRALHGLADDDLMRIPVLPVGARLQEGGTYTDLSRDPPREFTAEGRVSAQPGQYIVPKDRVPYTIWNRLLGTEPRE
ncbi:MAG TPA: hypothetical protein VFK13_04055 [Gemmatimonadaceae bacterium]|nr:hypothetical protein [Gemmatimonadaceae bacterium]